MVSQFARTELLYGEEAIGLLKNKRVAVFGVGGVGGYVCEALCRSGIGAFDIIDDDVVSLTNLNRQIIALHSTIGQPKTEVLKERMLDINPEVDVRVHRKFFLPENATDFPFEDYDYVVDAVDTVAAKLELVVQCIGRGIPIISAMGAGNKLEPERFVVTDIYKTSMCPLAKVMRQELRKRGVRKLKVVYSDEKPLKPMGSLEGDEMLHQRRSVPGSTAFAPAVAGLLLASEVMKDLITDSML